MKTFKVQYKVQKNERGFYFLEVRHGIHSYEKFILWIHPIFIQKENEREFVEFPVPNGRIEKTAKGSYVLRKVDGWVVWSIEWRSGYRGSSDVIIESDEAEIVKKLKILHSPLGNLGETTVCFLNIPVDKKVRIICKRSGRRIPEEEKRGIEFEIVGLEVSEVIDDDVEKLLKEEE